MSPIRTAIGLLRSMVSCGESHSEQSVEAVREALVECDRLESESAAALARIEEQGERIEELGSGYAAGITDASNLVLDNADTDFGPHSPFPDFLRELAGYIADLKGDA